MNTQSSVEAIGICASFQRYSAINQLTNLMKQCCILVNKPALLARALQCCRCMCISLYPTQLLRTVYKVPMSQSYQAHILQCNRKSRTLFKLTVHFWILFSFVSPADYLMRKWNFHLISFAENRYASMSDTIYSRLSLNGMKEPGKCVLTGVQFTERWTGVQNTSTKPILSEALDPFK